MATVSRPWWRRIASPVLKLAITVGAFYLLLTHPVRTNSGESMVALDAIVASVVEKGVGIIGIFLCFLITLPLGYQILGARAATIAFITVPAAVAIISGFFVIILHPTLVPWLLKYIPLARSNRVGRLL